MENLLSLFADLPIGQFIAIILLGGLPIWCSVSCYIAEKKGRFSAGWFILSLFLNFLAIPIVLLMDEKEGLHYKMDYKNSWTCPDCWTVNKEHAETCETCGRKKPKEIE